jgi:uncharacterized membrane protein
MTSIFTISEVFHAGWKRLTNNFWFLVLVTLLFGVLSMVLGWNDGPSGVDVLSRLINMFVSFFAMFTFIRFSFMIAKGQNPHWKDIVEFDSKLLGMYLLGALILSAGQMIGFLLLIIPGIIVCVRFGFFGFILIEEKLDPISALKKSWHMTTGYFWSIFWFGIILGLVNLLGMMALGVGLLITVPLSVLCAGYVYEKIKSAPQLVSHQPVASQPVSETKDSSSEIK